MGVRRRGIGAVHVHVKRRGARETETMQEKNCPKLNGLSFHAPFLLLVTTIRLAGRWGAHAPRVRSPRNRCHGLLELLYLLLTAGSSRYSWRSNPHLLGFSAKIPENKTAGTRWIASISRYLTTVSRYGASVSSSAANVSRYATIGLRYGASPSRYLTDVSRYDAFETRYVTAV